ncbi:MAG: hypothetical protein ACRCTP_04595 [Aeromonas popoffii]|uniref:hypothetical protein n=1 Tax=Aeromonas popoffii TaxID=70856 RepID=UPI003F350868
MIEQALDVKKLYEATVHQAKFLLKEAVATGDFEKALQVFQHVEELLPTTSWIPSREEYPLFREYIDRQDHFRREGTYGFLDMFEEEIWYFLEATDEEIAQIEQEDRWHPMETTAILLEVMKNGYSKFRFDW